MNDKSKLIAFILSVIPGLAHLYIGLKERAIIFFTLFVVGVTGGIGLSILTYANFFLLLTVIGYLVLWLISLIDMFSAWKSIEMRKLYNVSNNSAESQFIPNKKLNKKSISLALAVIPGAGHMYLGYQKKGLIIMGAFFFSIYFMGWLGISLLLFLLPLIWFYSLFDTMHIVDDSIEESEDKFLHFPDIRPEWKGITLIAIGLIIIVEKILYPLMDYYIIRYIQTTVVSLIFIIAGICMLAKGRKNNSKEENSNGENEND
ncbi:MULTISPECIES: hypothetical protein [unclassified Sedimentibacter]|uniref:hypothetical protein n=1 Tax=unclassified Sedimentibacter TaxID=2649220 RepID=UPI0027DFFE0F|nr:hypothetical protein [Sedimentibacter sp. MB35-C1]WMJ76339.1 hypothetical protein RBQ61_11965 [Sedimentibacter sp. MB35-C1]